MIHYFVKDNGLRIEQEDHPRGLFDKKNNPNMYLSRKGAVKAAIKELASHVKNCQDRLREYRMEI